MSVSIIIASYNSAEFLPAVLRSCLAQTRSAREIILVDDGSTDATSTVAEEFRGQIRYERVENGGVSRARNLGASLASSEWLLFLDSDDCLLLPALAALEDGAKSGSPGVVYGMVIERAQPPALARLNGFDFCAGDPPLPAERNYGRCAIITPGSAIVRKSLHERTGGFVPGFEPMEDRDYWIKCGLLAPVVFADTVVLDKTWRPASAGSQDARRIWNGLRSRILLPSWCGLSGLKNPFASSRRELVERALKEAIWKRTRDILPPLLEEAARCNVSVYWRLRARLLLAGRSVPALPSWWKPIEDKSIA